jgi:hypothetical protein
MRSVTAAGEEKEELYIVEFSDGSSMEVPELFLRRFEEGRGKEDRAQ